MRNPPRISIITPSYNQGHFIEDTIRSVLDQRYPDLEFIVMDGGSTDETISILKKYGDDIKWVSEPDEGQSHAINKGLAMATGDIVAYLNSDDLYEKGVLKKVASFFMLNPDSMWLTGRCRIIDEKEREFRGFIAKYKNFLLARYNYNILLITNFICQPATFFRREVIEELGVFDVTEHRVMDYEYWLRIGKKYRPGIINENLACFRVYQESKTSSTFTRTFAEELAVSKRYSSSLLIDSLHYLNYIAIITAYSVLDKLWRKNKTLP
ncbi:MAG: glycosyltransferase family 2 protein [Thermodesulfobacteriota bacterium]